MYRERLDGWTNWETSKQEGGVETNKQTRCEFLYVLFRLISLLGQPRNEIEECSVRADR